MTSSPPTRILVPVDFGDASAAAVALAGRVGAATGAKLTVLHAETVDVPPYFTHQQLDTIEREVRAARQHAERAVREFAAANTPAAVTARVVDDSETEAILAASREADLVVMGTHGRRGPKRWWLGSVAERVVREAHVPVLVVHAPPRDTASPAPPSSAVVLGGSAAGPDAHRWGETIASALGGPLVDGPEAAACDATSVAATSVVVVALPESPSQRSVHEHVVSLARTCTVPVLFVPTPARVPHEAGAGSAARA